MVDAVARLNKTSPIGFDPWGRMRGCELAIARYSTGAKQTLILLSLKKGREEVWMRDGERAILQQERFASLAAPGLAFFVLNSIM